MKIIVLATLLYLSFAQSRYILIQAIQVFLPSVGWQVTVSMRFFNISLLVLHLQYHCGISISLFYLSHSLTIHGLWPDTISSTTFGAFNSSVLSKNVQLLDDMHNYWPPQSKTTTSSLFLWDHEWTTHGKDYANIIYKLRPADFPGTVQQRNSQLQYAFYNDVINFYKKFSVKKLPGRSYTKATFASHLGITQSQLSFLCATGNILREVHVCFQILASGLHVANCVKPTGSCSGASVDLPSWSVKAQTRVFNYPKMS